MTDLVLAVVTRPRLWPAALRVWRSHLPTGWWRRAPFLPVPDRAWIAFRLETAYGKRRSRLDPDDLVAYLDWCERMQRAARE